MEMMAIGTPLQQKSTPPTWLNYGPLSDLTFTSAGIVAEPKAELMTQNSENSPKMIKLLSAFLAVGYIGVGLYFSVRCFFLSLSGTFSDAEWSVILGIGIIIYSLYAFVPFRLLNSAKWIKYSCFLISPIVLSYFAYYLFSICIKSNHNDNEVVIFILIFFGAAINFVSNILGLLQYKRNNFT